VVRGLHADRHVALRIAVRRAGPAVLASSATVVLGLGLLLADINSMRSLGAVCAIGGPTAKTMDTAAAAERDAWVVIPAVLIVAATVSSAA
jgi:predicted RND superfamily exporter protein